MATTAELWEGFTRRRTELATWSWLQALAGWDQQTGMPPGGASDRQDQEAALARLLHERGTDPALGELVHEIEGRADLDPLQRAAIDEASWQWARIACLPADLAERIARAKGEAMAAWLEARGTGDTGPWVAALGEVMAAVRERATRIAEATGQGASPAYDVLLEDYDRGVTSRHLEDLFGRLVPGLRALLERVGDPGPAPAWSAPEEAQLAVCREIVRAVGFDLNAGRLDRSEHPFTTRCGVRDVRITTRFLPAEPLASIYATLHEAGHGMYEQGMSPALAPAGLMNAASLGLHESQSRFWENAIGRSPAFVEWLHALLATHVGASVPPVEALVRQVNRVEPSLVRVEADEVTYNLHVALRFELERRLVSGELPVSELVDAWAEATARVLGLRADPRDPRTGVLQDIHWSFGLVGYFPSYTLGNLYAASFLVTVREDLRDLDALVRRGTFAPVLEWFRERVHQHGARLRAGEIVERAVGSRDHVQDLLDVLRERHDRATSSPS